MIRSLAVIAVLISLCTCGGENDQASGDQKETRRENFQLYFIALEDSGKRGQLIGCNDSAVPVQISLPESDTPIRAALDSLLNVRNRFYQDTELYHTLHQSELTVTGITQRRGFTEIALRGEFISGGVCDNPRIQVQLNRTAQQFHSVDSVRYTVNEEPLDAILSGR